jgi:hypothetical protein
MVWVKIPAQICVLSFPYRILYGKVVIRFELVFLSNPYGFCGLNMHNQMDTNGFCPKISNREVPYQVDSCEGPDRGFVGKGCRGGVNICDFFKCFNSGSFRHLISVPCIYFFRFQNQTVSSNYQSPILAKSYVFSV